MPASSRVLVAVSGGPDSLALLHALHALQGELALSLVVGHLNHRMRGPAGDADAAFVEAKARDLCLPTETGARDVAELSRRSGLSLEEAGRAARYRFFGRAARRTGCRIIATAHTADDRVETVLLHLLRGTGLDGLAGFPAARPLRPDRSSPMVVRPLFEVSRAEVLAYCAAHDLQPCHDSTNDSQRFLRNQVRHELLPLLESYSPAARRHLLRLARLAEEETAFLDARAAKLLTAAQQFSPQARGHAERHGEAPPGGRKVKSADGLLTGRPQTGPLRMARVVLAEAPGVLARRALRQAIIRLQPGPPPELATIERLLSLLRGERPGFPLPGGTIVARITEQELILERPDPVREFDGSEPVRLAVPGETELVRCCGTITATLVAAPPEELFSLLPLPPEHALLDHTRLVGSLVARPPVPGDRIQPLGMSGHRKLQDLLTDRKVPRALRRRLPVVCDAEKIVWIPNHCMNESVKITTETRMAVRLAWSPGAG